MTSQEDQAGWDDWDDYRITTSRMAQQFHYIAFGFISMNDLPTLLEENTYIGYLEIHLFMELLLKFKPASLLKQPKAYLSHSPQYADTMCEKYCRFQITHVVTLCRPMQICDVLSCQKCGLASAQFSYQAAVICEI